MYASYKGLEYLSQIENVQQYQDILIGWDLMIGKNEITFTENKRDRLLKVSDDQLQRNLDCLELIFIKFMDDSIFSNEKNDSSNGRLFISMNIESKSIDSIMKVFFEKVFLEMQKYSSIDNLFIDYSSYFASTLIISDAINDTSVTLLSIQMSFENSKVEFEFDAFRKIDYFKGPVSGSDALNVFLKSSKIKCLELEIDYLPQQLQISNDSIGYLDIVSSDSPRNLTNLLSKLNKLSTLIFTREIF